MNNLIKIALNGTDENDEINENDIYQCLIYDEICIGYFSKEWYGWTFDDWGTSGIQLGSIEEVYRIDKDV